MTYAGELDRGQQVYVENRGTQTWVTLVSASAGQQQSQRSSVETGPWTAPPTLFQTSTGLVLRLESSQGQRFLQLQAGGVSTLSVAPSLLGAELAAARGLASPPAVTVPEKSCRLLCYQG